MSDFDDEDEPYIPPQKHAARSSENDKAALLANQDEREEYTDIFEESSNTQGRVVSAVDFEEGESVSASDDEVAGYTGDMENYTESEIDPVLHKSTSALHIPEGTLININDNVTETPIIESDKEHNESDPGYFEEEPPHPPSKSLVTNESISEIAVKLKEVEVTPVNIAKPGMPVKVSEGDRSNTYSDSEERNLRGYISSGDTSKGKLQSQERKKKFRKRTTSHGAPADDVLSSSGEYTAEHEQYNGHSHPNEHKHKPRKKKDKSKQPNESSQHHTEETYGVNNSHTMNSNKLIDIETPPTTPHKPPTVSHKQQTAAPFDSASKKHSNSSSRNTKRKKTRHKIYLDDPDVHQLIGDQIHLLQKYAEDLKSGNYKRRQPQLTAGGRQNMQAPQNTMPVIGHNGYRSTLYNQTHHQPQQQQQQQHQQHHRQHPQTDYAHPQQHRHHHHHQQQQYQQQQPRFEGVSSQHRGSGIPYQGHTRGRDIIARIRKEEPSSSSSDEDCHTNNVVGRKTYNQGYNQVSTGNREQHGDDMYLCPDCGEYHHENDVADVQEICPDCGIAHNPYQHTPSQNNALQKYADACRTAMKPSSQPYERVSTEQDPEDVRQDTLPSIEGPHTENELTSGVRYKLKYLGSCQITTQHPVTKETRMQQAQDAYTRIKGQEDEDEDDVSTNVDMFISLERIKILNQDTKFEDVMMDHALRTVCFICDMGNVLVLMARRLTSDHATDFSIEQGKPISLGSIVGDREKKTSKNICHVFEGEYEASKIAKAIGQAFNIAYRQFLQSNGIAHEHVEEAEYCHVLESQKLVGQDLDRLTDQSSARDIVLTKRRGDPLGIMLLESGWGSMLPTVFIAHVANYSAAARSQRLSVGDHILTCNGASFVGLPLSECNDILKNTRSSERVIFRVVSCPPVVDVVVSRPDVKYQLGFSVQNGTICSLLRGGIAERGGVRVGHRIIEINGDSVVAKPHQYIVDILANTIGSISMKTMPVAMYRLMVGDDLPLHV